MAKFNLTGSKTVAELKKEFNEAFGSRLKVYNKNKIAEDTATLGELGLKTDTEFECRSSRTVGSFIDAFAEMGLKVKVYTKDWWVAVLDGITLETSGKLPKQITVPQQKEFIAYQREDKEVECSLLKIDLSDIGLYDDDVSYDIENEETGILDRAINKLVLGVNTIETSIDAEEVAEFDAESNDYFYASNFVINNGEVEFNYPCDFCFVIDGEVVYKHCVESLPEIDIIYLPIPWDGWKEEALEHINEGEPEWVEDDMYSLCADGDSEEATHVKSIDKSVDGLYITDIDDHKYALVLNGDIVYEID